jgi:Flp pilus assembly CpaF family ATPase
MALVDVEIASIEGTRTLKAVAGPLIIVGRGSDATVVLKHDDVSRKHASIEVGDAGLVVRDLSTNGTFVEGKRVTGELQLPFNKPIRIGPFTLRIRPPGSQAQTRAVAGEVVASPSGRVVPPPPPRPVEVAPTEAPKVVAEGARLSDSVELPPTKKKPHAPPVIVMPRPSAPPVVVAKKGGPVMPAASARQTSERAAAAASDARQTSERAATAASDARQTGERGAVSKTSERAAAGASAAASSGDRARGEAASAGANAASSGDRARGEAAPAWRGEPRPARGPEPPTVAVRSTSAAAQADAIGPPSDLSDQERDRLKRWLRGLLLESLDLPSLRPEELQDKALAPRVLALMDELLDEHARELPKGLDRGRLRKELADEVLGLGPLEDLLADTTVSEVMVVDRATIYIERRGRLELTGARFSSEDALRSAIERIVTPLGRRIDESTPMVDARLKDGSRVNAIIPPLALRGPCLTIRKFSSKKLDVEDLIGFGSLDARMARFLQRAVIARRNILVSGGTGSGKTTLLNVLSSAIPEDERIVTIEDAAELRLDQPHVVSLETRPPNMEGKGEYSIRDLVKNALRMRPDRIVVGECRGGEALDMLQAMNTGHDGSLTTTHANSPVEAIARLETLVLMGGVELPTRAIREQIANSIHVVVQQQRFVDGTRKITAIAEVVGIDDDGVVRLEPIFEFQRAAGERGKVAGTFVATGYMPSFIGEFITMGLVTDGEYL